MKAQPGKIVRKMKLVIPRQLSKKPKELETSNGHAATSHLNLQ